MDKAFFQQFNKWRKWLNLPPLKPPRFAFDYSGFPCQTNGVPADASFRPIYDTAPPQLVLLQQHFVNSISQDLKDSQAIDTSRFKSDDDFIRRLLAFHVWQYPNEDIVHLMKRKRKALDDAENSKKDKLARAHSLYDRFVTFQKNEEKLKKEKDSKFMEMMCDMYLDPPPPPPIQPMHMVPGGFIVPNAMGMNVRMPGLPIHSQMPPQMANAFVPLGSITNIPAALPLGSTTTIPAALPTEPNDKTDQTAVV
ncbi:hypothetical protein HK096_005538 [Nowakowskiella sp. JEL0078]|nr:hypothetical protein HK096_005538 [Nowakowskiella sp. JEL0078]